MWGPADRRMSGGRGRQDNRGPQNRHGGRKRNMPGNRRNWRDTKRRRQTPVQPEGVVFAAKAITLLSGTPGTDETINFVTSRFENHPGLKLTPLVRVGKKKFCLKFEVKDTRRGKSNKVDFEVLPTDLLDIKAYMGDEIPEDIIKAKPEKKADPPSETKATDETAKEGEPAAKSTSSNSDLDPDTMNVQELRDALAERGLYKRGLKAELIRRLKEYLEENKEEAPAAEEKEGQAATEENGESGAMETDQAPLSLDGPEETADGGEAENAAEEAVAPAEDEKEAETPAEPAAAATEESAEKASEEKGEDAEAKAAPEEPEEPPMDPVSYKVVIAAKNFKMKKRWEDILPREAVEQCRILIIDFQVIPNAKPTAKCPRLAFEAAMEKPLKSKHEDTVWPIGDTESPQSFHQVVKAAAVAANEYFSSEESNFTLENLIKDNLALKRKVKAITASNELKDVKIKTLQNKIKNVMSYLSNHKSEVEAAVKEHEEKSQKESVEEEAASATQTEENGESSKKTEPASTE